MSRKEAESPHDAVIVDETQDLDGLRLALMRMLAGKGRDSLTLLGDMNQRIHGEPLDLEDLRISVEGRILSLAAGRRMTREMAELGQRLLVSETGPRARQCTAARRAPVRSLGAAAGLGRAPIAH